MPSPAFEKAAAEAQQLPKKPSDDDLLQLYGLYKQATIGDCNTNKPTFDIKGRYKWTAWDNLKGMNQAEAETQYIAKVEELKKQ
ncbi:acyl-CoA-binding protein [Radiomyces spectabilis]|uniref:acyl-CoA-binding protein n=1 Tax=Radiomyces spectabilis TaxID=64574 RepID=UPI0022210BD0|nr:acyl-CoA-binding protein [Radiomyces spectabilis]KAI8366049.1 acyl-CoA-binding protein [Radiomyces spectabilis]